MVMPPGHRRIYLRHDSQIKQALHVFSHSSESGFFMSLGSSLRIWDYSGKNLDVLYFPSDWNVRSLSLKQTLSVGLLLEVDIGKPAKKHVLLPVLQSSSGLTVSYTMCGWVMQYRSQACILMRNSLANTITNHDRTGILK